MKKLVDAVSTSKPTGLEECVMYLAYYVFGVGHTERHYIKGGGGKTYNSTATRDLAQAKRFATAEAAEAAARRACERKTNPDYSFLPGVERVNK